MKVFLIVTFLFYIGSILGWIIEVIFRRFVSSKKWINPGFLVGPYLPLYGFGLIGLYGLSLIDLSFVGNGVIEVFIRILLMLVSMTLIEYLTGLIFIKGMHIKLWDYSDRKFNIQGIICPTFSFAWATIGVLYYYLIHPIVVNAINWYLFDNLAYSFVIGMFYGIMLIDFGYSINISSKIKKFAKENIIVIKYEELKLFVAKQIEQRKEKVHYWTPFKSTLSLKEIINKYTSQKSNRKTDKEKENENLEEKNQSR